MIVSGCRGTSYGSWEQPFAENGRKKRKKKLINPFRAKIYKAIRCDMSQRKVTEVMTYRNVSNYVNKKKNVARGEARFTNKLQGRHV